MHNYIQPGNIITMPAQTDTLAGEVVVIASDLLGIAAGNAAFGTMLDVTLEGVFSVPKKNGESFDLGAIVYFNVGLNLATSTVGSNPILGNAIEAVNGSGPTVKVRLRN